MFSKGHAQRFKRLTFYFRLSRRHLIASEDEEHKVFFHRRALPNSADTRAILYEYTEGSRKRDNRHIKWSTDTSNVQPTQALGKKKKIKTYV